MILQVFSIERIKKRVILMLTGMLCLSGYCQSPFSPIRVSEDMEVLQLTEDVWIHTTTAPISGYGLVASNGMIVVQSGEAWLFDTPVTDAQTEQLVTWISENLHARVVGFVPNHWHSDCMGGLGYLQSRNIRTYAAQKTIDIARSKKLPLPDIGFQDSLCLKVGNQTMVCHYLGPAHSMDNIVVWIPAEQILFAGCMIKSMASKNPGFTADGDLVAYPATLEKLIKKFGQARLVIPGHGNFGGPELITHTLGLLRN